MTHCLWSCPSSFLCWQWCAWLLKEILNHRNDTLDWQVVLTPAQVFIALPLPVAWRILENFGTSILRAVLCRQIWKAWNDPVFANRRSDHRRKIRKAWHYLGIYLQKEWHYFVCKVQCRKITSIEASNIMHSQFGSNQDIWNLHGWCFKSHQFLPDHLEFLADLGQGPEWLIDMPFPSWIH